MKLEFKQLSINLKMRKKFNITENLTQNKAIKTNKLVLTLMQPKSCVIAPKMEEK